MPLHDLKPAEGSRKKKTRVGRGPGSGLGKTCGRGHKGQKARKSGNPAPGFEGGQMPLHRRLPKRGFRNTRFANEYHVVQVAWLERFEDGAEITLASLRESGLVSGHEDLGGAKIIGKGELTKKLVVKVAKVTAGARERIEGAGGSVEGI